VTDGYLVLCNYAKRATVRRYVSTTERDDACKTRREMADNLSKLREVINPESNLSLELIPLRVSQGLRRKVLPTLAERVAVPFLSLEIKLEELCRKGGSFI